ncbi:16S rRNA (guanine(966)-N(2))-methyltransferase RsmD [Methylobacterium sp. J-076]|uniref:16S rRNA (guanine(966)-N(2))-methyltransferase RsmD n=1 Tax=Methylobacterium sp. J-076 TaxID=2836655 RepID=UPI001FBBAEAB|nr:16S rRNA (guanine(966)-N(2))-methyltransferase RsmD [Methylobacterium sp. J-076]MCJ2015673.1 16S rRNA (guanine(966)-N(2))-methyltransferase RsmD [Methylobacterium sp. J-076]
MRIVGGQWRGRRLATPRTDAIRPTSDRLRESLFNVLTHGYDDAVAGARVLDLFSGTGALGFEALSRGASYALLVDEGAEARSVIRTNIEAFGAEGVTRLFRRDATKLGEAGPAGRFSLLFCDPPYGRDLAPAALTSAAQGGWLASGALAVVEEVASAAVTLPADFAELERRVYGDTVVILARYGGSRPARSFGKIAPGAAST